MCESFDSIRDGDHINLPAARYGLDVSCGLREKDIKRIYTTRAGNNKIGIGVGDI